MPACPACGKDNFVGALECKFCGVLFKKWTKHIKLKKDLGLLSGEEVIAASGNNPTKKRQIIGIGIVLTILLSYFIFRKYFTVALGPNEIGFPIVEGNKWGFINAKGQLVGDFLILVEI